MIDIKHRLIGIIVLILGLLAVTHGMQGQNVVRHGNVFVQVDSSKSVKEPTKTEYVYVIDSVSYPIYLSSTGKAFIKRTSKRTGKEYRQYLPEVTKQIAHKKVKK